MTAIKKLQVDARRTDPRKELVEMIDHQRPQIRDGRRVWFADDSKLWYVSSQQAKAYLSIDSSKAYKKGMHNAEHDAIQLNMPRIIARMAPELYLFDLGCGTAMMTIKITKQAEDAGKKVGLVLVDLSLPILNVAVRNAKRAGIHDIRRVQKDFQKDMNGIVGTVEGTTQKLLNLGANFVNFDSDEILSTMSSVMREGDLVYFSAQINTKQNIAGIVQQYRSKAIERMVEGELSYLGFGLADLKYDTRFNLKTNRVECYCEVKAIPESIKTEKLRVGDEIVGITSFKPTLKQLERIVSRYFDGEFLSNSTGSYIGFIGTLKRV